MAATPQFAATPVVGALSMAAVAACTTRAPTATAGLAAANILPLTAVSAIGQRIDSISVVAASSSMTSATQAALVGIWVWDGTTAFLIAEITVSAVTPSTTVAAFTTTWTPANPIVLPATHRLYASTTVTTTASTNALSVEAFGGSY